jgi:hypothetical protein
VATFHLASISVANEIPVAVWRTETTANIFTRDDFFVLIMSGEEFVERKCPDLYGVNLILWFC